MKQSSTFLNQQRGYSLVELMIAMFIGLISFAGILHLFLNTKTAYRLTSESTQLQENARFINAHLSRTIRIAGFRSPPVSGEFSPVSTVFATTPYITGTFNDGINRSDTLSLSFQGSGNGTGTPDGTILDCLNHAVDANKMATCTFSLNAQRQLQCQALNPNAPLTNDTQVLVSNVENFKILFGEDLDGDNLADRYVNAAFPTLQMNRVVSVRISVLLTSQEAVKIAPQSISYNLLGQSYTPSDPQYLHQQFTFTIVLRNLLNLSQ